MVERQRPCTSDKLAARWACSPNHVRNLIHRGELRAFTIGRLFRIPHSAVIAFEAGDNGSDETGSENG